LIFYIDGKKSYIISPRDLQIGQTIVAGFWVTIGIGNALPIWKIPFGTILNNVELRPGGGGKIARSYGNRVRLISREGGFASIQSPSGEVRRVRETCWATIGKTNNFETTIRPIGKAGRSRWIGRRPVVRGSAINPVDHPNGGGEGRCPIGRDRPLTRWGKVRCGKPTRRKKKYSHGVILRRKKLLFLYLIVI